MVDQAIQLFPVTSAVNGIDCMCTFFFLKKIQRKKEIFEIKSAEE
jgi:hypothetical protein